ncbi:glycoside hydrolase family 3 N-terminal domain-containing protein [Desulfovibrio aminophilus]|uniref:glycoside hydrolase family 3 protein n=1 Tax=Desulfovibrio aminophilus TaxID=81425 RepID=UPI00339A3F99
MSFCLWLTLLTVPALAGPPADLERMAGQMLLVGFRGLEISGDEPIARDVALGRVGGVVLFDFDVLLKQPGRNIKNPGQVRRLTAALKALAPLPLIVAVDQEGGRVQRFKARDGFADTPSAAEMGSWDDPGRVRGAAEALGDMLRELGVNMDFAPCVDVNVNPRSPAIGALGRSFSPDPARVALNAEAFLRGLTDAGVLSCLKHFPGHGSAASDSHLGFTDVSATWREAELTPYRLLLARDRVDMVMTAHVFNSNLDQDYPASLSRRITTGLLRGELGFAGVIVTDDLQMRAVTGKYDLEATVRLALDAGADILLFGNNLAYDPDLPAKAQAVIVRLVRDGVVPESRVRESFERIMTLKNKLQ